MNDPLGLSTISESLGETTKAFEDMQKILLVYCGLVAIGIVITCIVLFRQKT